ncbi:uncharacterized protein VP01_1711g1 [Puccinia sorghi]|uniref:Uncharacterized protein n=1 Tax=Puccinia sorghi TaxID=27349 RepID=A0A0L6VFI6_9BASI|nr:uncharacterized protein VP01_1711g1 [Puccinia sorghi]
MSLRMPKADNMPLFKSGYTFASGIEEAVLRYDSIPTLSYLLLHSTDANHFSSLETFKPCRSYLISSGLPSVLREEIRWSSMLTRHAITFLFI